MTRKDVAAQLIAEAMLNKPADTDLPTHIADTLDAHGMLAKAPATGGRYTVVDGRCGPRIIYQPRAA